MTHYFFETIIPLAGAYIFSIMGCKIAEEHKHKYVELIAFVFCALLSHGGGLSRDILNMLVTHEFILPSAFTALDSWMAAFLAYVTYLFLKLTGNYKVLTNHMVTLALNVGDAAAVANYVFIGAARSVHTFGNASKPIIAVFAGMTALGGGLWALITYRPDRISKFKGNLIYYLSTLLSACIAANLVVLRNSDIEAVSLILSMICATVTIINDFLANRSHHSMRLSHKHNYRKPHRESMFNRPLSFGAYFALIKDLSKGIHLYLKSLLHTIRMKARCLRIIAVA